MAAAFEEMFAESEVPKEKHAKLAASMEALMSGMLDTAIEKGDVRWEARTEDLKQTYMAKVDEKLQV